MMRHKKTFDDRMNEGGIFFYAIAALSALGFYGLLWLAMAVGVMLE
jgi:hypothetical protein